MIEMMNKKYKSQKKILFFPPFQLHWIVVYSLNTGGGAKFGSLFSSQI